MMLNFQTDRFRHIHVSLYLCSPISVAVSTQPIEQSLYFLNPKFQATSHLICSHTEPGLCLDWSETRKTGFNSALLTAYLSISYTPIATAQKRNKLTLAPPWIELTQILTVKREMTIDSHVTASPLHNFSVRARVNIRKLSQVQ